MRQGTGEEGIVAESKLMLKPVLAFCGKLSRTSSRPGILKAPCQQRSNLTAQCAGKPAARDSNENDAASSSQVWLTDAKLSERARNSLL